MVLRPLAARGLLLGRGAAALSVVVVTCLGPLGCARPAQRTSCRAVLVDQAHIALLLRDCLPGAAEQEVRTVFDGAGSSSRKGEVEYYDLKLMFYPEGAQLLRARLDFDERGFVKEVTFPSADPTFPDPGKRPQLQVDDAKAQILVEGCLGRIEQRERLVELLGLPNHVRDLGKKCSEWSYLYYFPYAWTHTPTRKAVERRVVCQLEGARVRSIRFAPQ